MKADPDSTFARDRIAHNGGGTDGPDRLSARHCSSVDRQSSPRGWPSIALFVWLPAALCFRQLDVTIARDDDTTFGILHSRFHELWSLANGDVAGVGNDPRYTPSTTFETFPFPEGLTPNIPAADYADDPRAVAIAEAAEALNDLREAWLNPADLVRIEPEVVPGYPDRILPAATRRRRC